MFAESRGRDMDMEREGIGEENIQRSNSATAAEVESAWVAAPLATDAWLGRNDMIAVGV